MRIPKETNRTTIGDGPVTATRHSISASDTAPWMTAQGVIEVPYAANTGSR